MSGLRSEHISNRLFFFMLVIILSLLFMAVPLIVSSYQEYLKTKQALVEIKSLRSIAEVANKVSKERAPANKLMSSNAADFLKNQKNLKEYRLSVDRQLNETIHILKEEGYTDLANTLDTKFRDDLKQARAVVDIMLQLLNKREALYNSIMQFWLCLELGIAAEKFYKI